MVVSLDKIVAKPTGKAAELAAGECVADEHKEEADVGSVAGFASGAVCDCPATPAAVGDCPTLLAAEVCVAADVLDAGGHDVQDHVAKTGAGSVAARVVVTQLETLVTVYFNDKVDVPNVAAGAINGTKGAADGCDATIAARFFDADGSCDAAGD